MIDTKTMLDAEQMQSNILYTEDIVIAPSIAPPNALKMKLLETAYTDIFSKSDGVVIIMVIYTSTLQQGTLRAIVEPDGPQVLCNI